jgi:hypothetical protein
MRSLLFAELVERRFHLVALNKKVEFSGQSPDIHRGT